MLARNILDLFKHTRELLCRGQKGNVTTFSCNMYANIYCACFNSLGHLIFGMVLVFFLGQEVEKSCESYELQKGIL